MYIKKFKRHRPQHLGIARRPITSRFTDTMTRVPGLMRNVQRHMSMRDVILSRLRQTDRFTNTHARRYSHLENIMSRHPNIRRDILRQLTGPPTDATPDDVVDVEHLRASSRSLREATQEDYEEQGLSDIADTIRNF